MKTRLIAEYVLTATIVLILGGLAGWYFFIRTQTTNTAAQNAARGYGAAIPEGDAGSSATDATPNSGQTPTPNPAPTRGFFSRLWSTLTGGAGGALPTISSFSGGTPSFSDTTSVSDSQQPTEQSAPPKERPAQLWHVEAKPVAGEAFVGNGTALRLRYVERASGYVFEADPSTGRIVRLTNTLNPKIYAALLARDGHVYERSIDASGSITTFVGTISTSTASSTQVLSGTYLVKDITNIATDPVSGALFYMARTPDGIVGISAEWNGAKQKTLFSSGIMHWQPVILGDGRIVLTQAAADGVPGYGYELKKDGTLSQLLGPVPGLSLRVRSAPGAKGESALLWSQSQRGVMSLFAQVDKSATAVQLSIRTLADKCVWSPGTELIAYCGVPQGSPGQNFLDNWYRGAAHSSDALWRIDASAGTAEVMYTPPSNTPIDIEDMSVDAGGTYLTFKNAADKSLWLLRLQK